MIILVDFPPEEIRCIEIAVQHETTGKLYQGAVEVAQVVINRTRSDGYPSTPCAVVYQKHQFTNVRNTQIVSQKAKVATATALSSYKDGTANTKIIAFHSLKAAPKSWRKLHFVLRKGDHMFYSKEK